jgi:hypothetical protein
MAQQSWNGINRSRFVPLMINSEVRQTGRRREHGSVRCHGCKGIVCYLALVFFSSLSISISYRMRKLVVGDGADGEEARRQLSMYISLLNTRYLSERNFFINLLLFGKNTDI